MLRRLLLRCFVSISLRRLCYDISFQFSCYGTVGRKVTCLAKGVFRTIGRKVRCLMEGVFLNDGSEDEVLAEGVF